jgi:uncharacterized membrane protein
VTITQSPDQLYTERDNTKGYAPDDHRVYQSTCIHTRFWDKDLSLRYGICMDCGSEIEYGSWAAVVETPELDDDTLTSERVRYNEFWGFASA